MNYMAAQPDFLWLLLLVPLPFVIPTLHQAAFPSLHEVPNEGVSSLIGLGIKITAALAIAAAAIALSRPFRLAETVKLRAIGAHVVILMDRSLSMDFTFQDDDPTGNNPSKTQIAAQLLTKFVDESPHDQFGVAAFTTSPIMVLPISGHRAAVTAAIAALRRPGVPGTNVGRGLQLALNMIAHDQRAIAPAVLLVSDGEYGGAGFFQLDLQKKLRKLFQAEHAHLYWLFLRPHKGNENIFAPPPKGEEDSPNTRPERYMDLFFRTLGVTYRVFWADNPSAIQDAVAEINRLETRPVSYYEEIPRKDITEIFYLVAALACLLLVIVKLMEIELAGVKASSKEADGA